MEGGAKGKEADDITQFNLFKMGICILLHPHFIQGCNNLGLLLFVMTMGETKYYSF